MSNQLSSRLQQLTDKEFEQKVIQSDRPVLVDFWAEWCGPCRALAPTLEELAENFSDRATVAKVNVDENPDVTSRYGIRAIPTLILFKDGEEQERLVGAQSKSSLANALERYSS